MSTTAEDNSPFIHPMSRDVIVFGSTAATRLTQPVSDSTPLPDFATIEPVVGHKSPQSRVIGATRTGAFGL